MGKAEHYLVSFAGEFINPYSAICVSHADMDLADKIPDFHDLYDQVEIIVKDALGYDRVKELSL